MGRWGLKIPESNNRLISKATVINEAINVQMTLGRKKEIPPLQESSLLLLYSLTPAQGLPVFIVLFIQVLAQSHTPEANPGLGRSRVSQAPGTLRDQQAVGCTYSMASSRQWASASASGTLQALAIGLEANWLARLLRPPRQGPKEKLPWVLGDDEAS